jgi:hypothetical protein
LSPYFAVKWYRELEQLGYTEHMVAAQDGTVTEHFAGQKMRHDFVYNHDNVSPFAMLL